MPERFYFDLEDGEETIRDEEGVEASGLDEALAEARSVIAEMIDEIEDDASGRTWTLVVRDANRRALARLPVERR